MARIADRARARVNHAEREKGDAVAMMEVTRRRRRENHARLQVRQLNRRRAPMRERGLTALRSRSTVHADTRGGRGMALSLGKR